MPKPTPKTLHEKISEAIRGGCYRFRGEPEENIFQPGGLDYDASGNPMIHVSYPVKDTKGAISFNSRLLECEYVSVTQIDKIRARYDAAQVQIKKDSAKSNIIYLQPALEKHEKEARTKSIDNIVRLADHIPNNSN